MILEILVFLVFISLLFYTLTYPYNFKLNRKLKRVLNFSQVEKITDTNSKYLDFSHK